MAARTIQRIAGCACRIVTYRMDGKQMEIWVHCDRHPIDPAIHCQACGTAEGLLNCGLCPDCAEAKGWFENA
jgi:hypothetical protein